MVRLISVVASLLILTGAFHTITRAQDSTGNDTEPPLIDQTRALKMDSLQRGIVTAHYTPGCRKDASELAHPC